LEPDIDTEPAPIVRAEVLAALPTKVTVPVFTVKAVVKVALVTVAALPPIESPEAVPVKLVATPDEGVPRAPPEYNKVAFASGSVKVLVEVVGPENVVKPLPVPPFAAPSIPVIVDEPRARVNPVPVDPAVKVPTVAISVPTSFAAAIEPARSAFKTAPVSASFEYAIDPASIVFVTAPESIDHVAPDPDTVISPLSPSDIPPQAPHAGVPDEA
jgi:hypothetical protein